MSHRIDWSFGQGKLLKQILRRPHLIGRMVGRDLLEDQHSDWIRWVWGQPSGVHAGLQAHRGAYKTTAVTEIGIIWWWLFHPMDRIALVRKTFTAAADSLAVIKQLMEREEIRELFRLVHGKAPEFLEKRADRLTFDFKRSVTKEGSLGAYGINNLPTGLHVDRALCDDIVTDDDKWSKAEREKTIRSVQELLSNIIDRGKSVMFVGTTWHKEDAWEEVINAACPNGVKKFTRDDTGLISDEEFAKICTLNTPAMIAANYFLKHIASDDLLFQNPARENYWIHGVQHHVTAHLDAKFDGDHTTALTIMQQLPETSPNGRPWIQVTGWCTGEHAEKAADAIVDRCIKHKVRHFFQERNPDKGMLYRAIMDRFRAKGYTINTSKAPEVYNYQESTNKQYKIQTHLLYHWQNLVWDINCDRAYRNQILDYQEGAEPDDCPDSAASLLRCFYDTTTTGKPKSVHLP